MVTGVGGFLGSHVLDQLLHAGHTVVGLDSLNHNGESMRLVEATTRLTNPGQFHWMCHDLTAPFSSAQLRRLEDVDAIIHVASLASVDASIRDPASFARTNVNSTLTMLELARQIRPKYYVHMSTDEVYGAQMPCSDGHHAPSSPYAASKAAQEDLCFAWWSTYNVPVMVVRSANMFGERQSTLAFIPRLVQQLLTNQTVMIHVDGDGKPGTRNYSYVGNVARYIVDQVTTPGNFVARETTLRGQMTLDNYSLALNVAALLDRELKCEFVDAERVRPGYDREYALHGIEWYPELGAGEALRRTVHDTARRLGWSG